MFYWGIHNNFDSWNGHYVCVYILFCSYVRQASIALEILLAQWPDKGTPQNFGETILWHFLIDMMVLIKNKEVWGYNPGVFR